MTIQTMNREHAQEARELGRNIASCTPGTLSGEIIKAVADEVDANGLAKSLKQLEGLSQLVLKETASELMIQMASNAALNEINLDEINRLTKELEMSEEEKRVLEENLTSNVDSVRLAEIKQLVQQRREQYSQRNLTQLEILQKRVQRQLQRKTNKS